MVVQLHSSSGGCSPVVLFSMHWSSIGMVFLSILTKRKKIKKQYTPAPTPSHTLLLPFSFFIFFSPQLGKKPAKKKMTKAELAAFAEMDAKAGEPEPSHHREAHSHLSAIQMFFFIRSFEHLTLNVEKSRRAYNTLLKYVCAVRVR